MNVLGAVLLPVLVVACATEYPDLAATEVMRGVPRSEVTQFEGAIYYLNAGSVYRFDGEASALEASGLTWVDSVYDGRSRFFTDGDRLWARGVTERDGPDEMIERDQDGRWTRVELPVERVNQALPGTDPWIMSDGVLYRWSGERWTTVPVEGRPVRFARSDGSVVLLTASDTEESRADYAVWRWDADGFVPMGSRVTPVSPRLWVADGRAHVPVEDARLQPLDPAGGGLVTPPPIPARYYVNASGRYERGAGGTVLYVHHWTADPERAPCCPAYTSVDRWEGGRWRPLAVFDWSAYAVHDLGGDQLLVEGRAGEGWALLAPRAAP